MTIRAGAQVVALRAMKAFRAGIGEPVSFLIPPSACHLFDAVSGVRLGPSIA